MHEALADQLTDIVVDAVLAIRKPDEHIDLFMARALNRTRRPGLSSWCMRRWRSR